MSEPADAAAAQGQSAGAMLRQARLAQGMHIAALAAAIKVTPRKLEALENDRFDELPDATFARALAKTVCRQLKTDPEPVLAKLPLPAGHRLEHVNRGIGERFRERPGHAAPVEPSVLTKPIVWGPALILAAAVALSLLPAGWIERRAPAPAASGVERSSAPASVAEPHAPAPAQAFPPAIPASDAQPAVPAAQEAAASEPESPLVPSGALVLRTQSDSWVEVRDARGRALLNRTLATGETVTIDGDPPLRLRIGNARGTQLTFRGKPIDLGPVTRDNIARLELK